MLTIPMSWLVVSTRQPELSSWQNACRLASIWKLHLISLMSPWKKLYKHGHMNIPHSYIHEPKQARYIGIYLVLSSITPNKHPTHEYFSFFHPSPQTSTLHTNIPRSFIHASHQTSTLHTNIPRSWIHHPKQARYTRLYLILASITPKKHECRFFRAIATSPQVRVTQKQRHRGLKMVFGFVELY